MDVIEKIRRLLVIGLVGVLIVSPWSGVVGATLAGETGDAGSPDGVTAQSSPELIDVDASNLPGDGTEADPYQISNVSELQAMEDNLSAHYVLVSDIDASATATANGGKGFEPIGRFDPFIGSFDGQGHTIQNLTINRSGEIAVGVFGNNGGIIQDIEATTSVSGLRNVGGLVGNNSENGAILESSVSGSVTGEDPRGVGGVGGLVGNNDGAVRNTSVSGSVLANGPLFVGGLVGSNEGTIRNASASGSVNGSALVGGLVGFNVNGTIQNASITGSVNGSDSVGGLVGTSRNGTILNTSADGSVNGSLFVGGLVGNNANGIIQNASTTGSVNGSEFVGGLVGVNSGNSTIQGSSASGSATGSDEVGGLVGLNIGNVTVQESSASGLVTGSEEVGGLVGSNLGNGTIRESLANGPVTGSNLVGGLIGSNSGIVVDAFATGSVTGSSQVGGLIGSNQGTVQDSYWDETATGQSTSAGSATGLTTAEMQGQTARSNMDGLAFGTVWQTRPGDYPVLIALSDQRSSQPAPDPAPPAIDDDTSVPTDPDGDGVYEDVNGDGRFNIIDVADFLDHYTDETVQNNADQFNFDGEGGVNIIDVSVLLDQVL